MQVIEKTVYTFSKDNPPVARAQSGELLHFKTCDCFDGQISKEEQLIHELDLTKANPATGPVYIEGAQPGDTLAVEILDIKTADKGFACSIGETGPLHDISEVRTRVIPVVDGAAEFNGVKWNVTPMIGVIGTAPAEGAVACGYAANHGGNLDSKLISKGAVVYLPVRVEGGLLQMGDLHASMGDGEVSGTGIEIPGDVIVRVSLIKDFKLEWPVTETHDFWYVNSVDTDYGKALSEAAHELNRLMEPTYGWDATDIMIYLSINGQVGINQSVQPIHGAFFTMRFGIPKIAGQRPLVPFE